MSDPEPPEVVERAFEASEAFDSTDGGYALSTTVFETAVTATAIGDGTATAIDDGTATATEDGPAARFHASIWLPTLDAAVAGEPVPAVVEDGWFETLDRRLQDAFSVAQTDGETEPVLERDEGVVRVRLTYAPPTARQGVADAKTLIEFVEGTYAQGIIPGYEYRGPAATLVERASNAGGSGR